MKLKLFYPIKPKLINQPFGTAPQIYGQFGLKGHNGLDFAAAHGQPIYASHPGIAFYEIDNSQGHGVVIKSNDMYDYAGTQVYMKTIYWHMCDSKKEPKYKSPIEEKPIQVKTGDLIGYADSTGFSSGDHLHFGLKPVAMGEPYDTTYNFAQNNGYLGAIDPTPFFNGLFAQDINNPIKDKYVFEKDLSFGTIGQDVFNLQKRLIEEKVATFSMPTGYFGSKTELAVKLYQARNDINTTGYVGILTRTSLNK